MRHDSFEFFLKIGPVGGNLIQELCMLIQRSPYRYNGVCHFGNKIAPLQVFSVEFRKACRVLVRCTYTVICKCEAEFISIHNIGYRNSAPNKLL